MNKFVSLPPMMEFRTKVETGKAEFQIGACEEVLLVGSCFAGEMGLLFKENGFPATVNPYGTMYNPASILHTLERLISEGRQMPRIVFLTLGTNHVYRLKETSEIVDNCEKRPAALFQEEELTVDECTEYLRKAVELLQTHQPDVQVVMTVSPIRYRKYGYHKSQLSKATLLLAIDKLTRHSSFNTQHSTFTPISYFPAYEILMDELRDYRFYAADMLHPSEQAVKYVWEQLVVWCFSNETNAFMEEWRPIREALQHRPFHPESEEYLHFVEKTQARLKAFQEKYPSFNYG